MKTKCLPIVVDRHELQRQLRTEWASAELPLTQGLALPCSTFLLGPAVKEAYTCGGAMGTSPDISLASVRTTQLTEVGNGPSYVGFEGHLQAVLPTALPGHETAGQLKLKWLAHHQLRLVVSTSRQTPQLTAPQALPCLALHTAVS